MIQSSSDYPLIMEGAGLKWSGAESNGAMIAKSVAADLLRPSGGTHSLAR